MGVLVREKKTEVGRGQNGCEGCRAPPPPALGASPLAWRAAVFRLRAPPVSAPEADGHR